LASPRFSQRLLAAGNVDAVVWSIATDSARLKAHCARERMDAAAVAARGVVGDPAILQRQAGAVEDDNSAAQSADRTAAGAVDHRAALQHDSAAKDAYAPALSPTGRGGGIVLHGAVDEGEAAPGGRDAAGVNVRYVVDDRTASQLSVVPSLPFSRPPPSLAVLPRKRVLTTVTPMPF